jgi:aminopeptidase N
LPGEGFLQVGKNTVKIDFTADYVNDCQGMHHFKDSADQNEYLYTNAEPNHAHIWFPCFDQPDLKAAYELLVLAPEAWVVVSNAPGELLDTLTAKKAEDSFSVTGDMVSQYKDQSHKVFRFDRTVPISTYLYAVIAGSYAVFTPSPKNADPQIPMKLYVRQSLKE